MYALVIDSGSVAAFPCSRPYQHRYRVLRKRQDRLISYSKTSLGNAYEINVDMQGSENPFLESLVDISIELEKRVKLGVSCEHLSSKVSSDDIRYEDDQLPTHRGIFCGFTATKEEIQRLKSADPCDFLDDE